MAYGFRYELQDASISSSFILKHRKNMHRPCYISPILVEPLKRKKVGAVVRTIAPVIASCNHNQIILDDADTDDT